ncbi:MAG: BON domain-containing protein [Candidimonas sp.]|jgi:hyperosmotically inducible protein
MNIRKLTAAAALGAGIALAPVAFAANDGGKASMGDYASDTAVTTKIKAAILAEKELSVLDISVETTDGVATLSGKVNSQAEADLAEKTARGVEGVKDVHNTLTLEPPKAN